MTTANRITVKHVAGLLAALALAAPSAAFASTGKHEAQGHTPAVAMEQKTATSKAADKDEKAKSAKDNAAKNTAPKKPAVQKAGAAH
jgi:hypothetical protein